MATRSTIGSLASATTKKQFADNLSSYVSLTSTEIAELFPTKTDREELLELIKIVTADTEDKKKEARLIDRIGQVSGAVIKILKQFTAGL